jgi:hypothetical protein
MNRGSGVRQHPMVEHKERQLEPVGYADLRFPKIPRSAFFTTCSVIWNSAAISRFL